MQKHANCVLLSEISNTLHCPKCRSQYPLGSSKTVTLIEIQQVARCRFHEVRRDQKTKSGNSMMLTKDSCGSDTQLEFYLDRDFFFLSDMVKKTYSERRLFRSPRRALGTIMVGEGLFVVQNAISLSERHNTVFYVTAEFVSNGTLYSLNPTGELHQSDLEIRNLAGRSIYCISINPASSRPEKYVLATKQWVAVPAFPESRSRLLFLFDFAQRYLYGYTQASELLRLDCADEEAGWEYAAFLLPDGVPRFLHNVSLQYGPSEVLMVGGTTEWTQWDVYTNLNKKVAQSFFPTEAYSGHVFYAKHKVVSLNGDQCVVCNLLTKTTETCSLSRPSRQPSNCVKK